MQAVGKSRRSRRDPHLARISHQLTVEAHDRPAITSLRLLTVLNVLFKYARIVQKRRAERRAPCTDGPLTHFASPPGEKSGLEPPVVAFATESQPSRDKHSCLS